MPDRRAALPAAAYADRLVAALAAAGVADVVVCPGSRSQAIALAAARTARAGGIALHVRVLAGRDPHHVVEAQFKALARALRSAVEPDQRVTGIPSAKGAL